MKYRQAEEAVEVWQRSWSGVLGACFAGHYRGVVATGLFSGYGLIIIAWHPATRRGHGQGISLASCIWSVVVVFGHVILVVVDGVIRFDLNTRSLQSLSAGEARITSLIFVVVRYKI